MKFHGAINICNMRSDLVKCWAQSLGENDVYKWTLTRKSDQ